MELLPGAPTNCPSLNVVVDGDASSLLVYGLHGEQEFEPVGCCGVVPMQLPLHLVPVVRLLPPDVLHSFPKGSGCAQEE